MHAFPCSKYCHTHEQVICVWHITTDTEKLHQIVKLAVNVAAYLESRQLAGLSHIAGHGHVLLRARPRRQHCPPRSAARAPCSTARGPGSPVWGDRRAIAGWPCRGHYRLCSSWRCVYVCVFGILLLLVCMRYPVATLDATVLLLQLSRGPAAGAEDVGGVACNARWAGRNFGSSALSLGQTKNFRSIRQQKQERNSNSKASTLYRGE